MTQPDITCTRRLQFCAGHRVMGHETKCAHLHGHNYVVELTARAVQIDSIGRVIDFSVLKEKIGAWIDTFWDHGFIICQSDYEARNLLCEFRPYRTDQDHSNPKGKAWEQKLYYMPHNPTAERMAEYLGTKVGPQVLEDTGVELVEVVLHETENCKATWKIS